MAQAAGYSFNSDTVSGSTVRDLAGYFLNGTILGSAAIATGKYGNGLNCTGGALRIGPVDQFTYPADTTGGLSVAAWVKLNTTTAAVRCIASATASSTLKWAVYASNASGNVEAVIGGSTYTTTTSIRDGVFHHVLVVMDIVAASHTVKIYVDGTQVLSTAVVNSLTYGANFTVEAGRNALSGSESLDGIIDDLRWWNDPVDSTSVSNIVAAEQIDFQLAVYPFDDDTTEDFSVYNRDLTKAASASYATGLYGRALTSTATAAGASATVSFGDLDRLAITGWLRLDTAPSGSPAPILAIDTTGGSSRLRVVVNLDRTITATWVTIYGTFAVSSGSALTVGQFSRFHINMNPTYVGMRLNSTTQTTTVTGNATPHMTPTVLALDKMYVGGDATVGGQVTFDYLTFTKNYIDTPVDRYWTGAVTAAAQKPANTARGVYHFNENTGTTTVDTSPSGNNLTLAAAGVWTTGVNGSALGVTTATGPGASNGAITWPASPPGWAFAAWVKAHVSASGSRIVVLRNGSSEVAHAGFLNNAMWVRLFGSGGTTGVVNPAAAPITAETWTHIAASCNGNTIQFFVNGVQLASASYSQGTLLQPTILNVGGDTGDQATADVDDLVLFDTPISATNVSWLYQNSGSFLAPASVSATRATTWNTKARTTSTRVTSWDTRVSVAATRSTTWNVLGALVAVSASRSTTWNVLTNLVSVSSTKATTWRTLARVTGGRSTTWSLEGPVVVPTYRVKFPTYKAPLGRQKPLSFMTYDAPYALVKVNGEWIETAMPSQELLRVSENFYLGGYYYELTSEEAAGLPPQYVEAVT